MHEVLVFYHTYTVHMQLIGYLCAMYSFTQAVLFFAAAGLYLGGRQEYLGFLVLCLALSWVNLLFYSRGDKHMGIYSVMIQKVQSTPITYSTTPKLY